MKKSPAARECIQTQTLCKAFELPVSKMTIIRSKDGLPLSARSGYNGEKGVMDTIIPPTTPVDKTNTKNHGLDREMGLKQTITAQDWTGPEDPENPMNWPLWDRIYHTIPPAAFAWIVTFGSSVYTPGISDIMRTFDVSMTIALLGLSLYVLGLAFGPILAAPISETLGRRTVYFASTPIAALFILGAGVSQSFAAFATCRFFAAFFASPVLAVGAGTQSDLWAPVHRATSTSAFLLAPFLGTALGPTVGGFAAQYKGWRWTQWPILFILVPSYLGSLFMKETYKKIILQNRAKRLGIPPPVNTGPKGLDAIKFLLAVTLMRPVKMLFVEPIVAFFSLYTAFNFAVLFGFFAAFPLVFEGTYHMQSGFYGLTYFGIAFGCCLTVVTVIVIDKYTFRKEHARSLTEGRGGVVAPEHRLYPAMVGSFGLPLALFWFAWTAKKEVHWISPVLAEIPFGWGNLCVFVSHCLSSALCRERVRTNPKHAVFSSVVPCRRVRTSQRCLGPSSQWTLALPPRRRIPTFHYP